MAVLADEGADEAAGVEGAVYRGLRVALTSLSKNYVRGRNVTWVGFTSTTTDKDETMRRFAGGGAGGGSGGATFVQADVADARDVSVFSPVPEAERPMMINSTFHVVVVVAAADAPAFLTSAVMAMSLAGSADSARAAGASVNLPGGADMIFLRSKHRQWPAC